MSHRGKGIARHVQKLTCPARQELELNGYPATCRVELVRRRRRQGKRRFTFASVEVSVYPQMGTMSGRWGAFDIESVGQQLRRWGSNDSNPARNPALPVVERAVLPAGSDGMQPEAYYQLVHKELCKLYDKVRDRIALHEEWWMPVL